MYHQILTATSPQSALHTFPFPMYYGQMTAHRCWIHIGQDRPNIVRRTNYDHRLMSQIYDPNVGTVGAWARPKCTASSSIILLYTSSSLSDLNQNLPQHLALDLTTATAQKIYDFVWPPTPTNPNNPATPPPPLPIRYLTDLQRQLILKALLKLGHEIDPASILWPEPADPTLRAQLQAVNHELLPLQLTFKTKAQIKNLQKHSPMAHQEQFFRLYTAHEQGRDTDHKGWPNPASLIEREKQILDPKYLTHPMTLERWAKWELAFTHWHNLQYLQHHHPLTFFPNELLKMASLLEQVTGTNPLQPQTNPNPPHDQTTNHPTPTTPNPTNPNPTETLGPNATVS